MTRSRYSPTIAFLLLMATSSLAWGGELVGLWQEYNDDTGAVEAFIRIVKLPDNSYEGKIEKIISSTVATSTLVCTQCPGHLKNKPYLGLRILSGMRRQDSLNFEGGEILDPEDGKTYQCQIQLSEDGKSIRVTGYLEYRWIGHSETWLRAK